MAKSFFEVFPQLKLDTDLHAGWMMPQFQKFPQRDRETLCVSTLVAAELLPKEKIYFLESELKRQLFPHHTMNIKIIEHFQLSEQYTLKNLLDVYWSSILTEFHRYSLLEYNLLRQAKVDVVEENTLRISLEDSVTGSIRKKKKSITFWKKYSMNDVICPCRFRWSFMRKKNPNTGKCRSQDAE